MQTITRVWGIIIAVLLLTYPASAWAWDDSPDDWDARILQALDDPATWGMVLTEVDAWTADEMWGLVESVDIPPVSQTTRALIRDKLAIDNRIPDNRFTHMPHAEEGWLIHLLVGAVIIVALVLIGYVAPHVSAWVAAQQATTAAVAAPVESAAVAAPVESAVATSAKAALEMAKALKISGVPMSVVETEVVSAQTNLELGEMARAWVHALCAWEHVQRAAGMVDASTASVIQNAISEATTAFLWA